MSNREAARKAASCCLEQMLKNHYAIIRPTLTAETRRYAKIMPLKRHVNSPQLIDN